MKLTFLISSTISFATDPFDGTWKQCNDLSGGQLYVKHENLPILEIKVVVDQATIIDLGSGNTEAFVLDGTPTKRKIPKKFEGDVMSLKRVSSNVWEYNVDAHNKIQTGRKTILHSIRKDIIQFQPTGKF